MPWIEPSEEFVCLCDACGRQEGFGRSERHYNSPDEHGIWGADDDDFVNDWLPEVPKDKLKGTILDRDWSHVKGQGYVVFCSLCCEKLRGISPIFK